VVSSEFCEWAIVNGQWVILGVGGCFSLPAPPLLPIHHCQLTIKAKILIYQTVKKGGLRNRFRLLGEKIGGSGRKKFGTIVAQPYFCTPFDENVRIAR